MAVQKLRKQDKIKESEVEEALVSNLFYLRRILNLPYEVRIIARQLRLGAGDQRLDLLITHGDELCLIELKVTEFSGEYIEQINNDRRELIELQNQGQLLKARIRAFLIVTNFESDEKQLCESNQIEMLRYEPTAVLSNYFEKLSALAPFLRIKPNDYGVFNIGLINRVLNELGKGIVVEEKLAKIIGLSRGSIHNHLRVATEFGLVRERNKQYFLTDFGARFVAVGEAAIKRDQISTDQAELLKEFIAEDPFYSNTIFGIYSIVESAFLLSRNSYPIDFESLTKIFRTVGGKVTEWQARKSQSTATYTFLNFAIDLGLLGKIGKQVLITPAGFRFILMLQLHKSIEMIESLSK